MGKFPGERVLDPPPPLKIVQNYKTLFLSEFELGIPTSEKT